MSSEPKTSFIFKIYPKTLIVYKYIISVIFHN